MLKPVIPIHSLIVATKYSPLPKPLAYYIGEHFKDTLHCLVLQASIPSPPIFGAVSFRYRGKLPDARCLIMLLRALCKLKSLSIWGMYNSLFCQLLACLRGPHAWFPKQFCQHVTCFAFVHPILLCQLPYPCWLSVGYRKYAQSQVAYRCCRFLGRQLEVAPFETCAASSSQLIVYPASCPPFHHFGCELHGHSKTFLEFEKTNYFCFQLDNFQINCILVYTLSHLENDRDVSAYSVGRRL